MGSSASKTAAKSATAAAGSARRQYPTRLPPNPSSSSQSPSSNMPPTPPPPAGQPAAPGPAVHPQSQASFSKDASITNDASDPDFAASLRSLGPVTPSSTLSNSSTFSNAPPSRPSEGSKSSPSSPFPGVFPDQSQNPALQVLVARERIAAEAEKEFGIARVSGGERRFVDVGVIREVLVLRDVKQLSSVEIEQKLGLKSGVVAMLSRVGEARIGAVDGGDSGIY